MNLFLVDLMKSICVCLWIGFRFMIVPMKTCSYPRLPMFWDWEQMITCMCSQIQMHKNMGTHID